MFSCSPCFSTQHQNHYSEFNNLCFSVITIFFESYQWMEKWVGTRHLIFSMVVQQWKKKEQPILFRVFFPNDSMSSSIFILPIIYSQPSISQFSVPLKFCSSLDPMPTQMHFHTQQWPNFFHLLPYFLILKNKVAPVQALSQLVTTFSSNFHISCLCFFEIFRFETLLPIKS